MARGPVAGANRGSNTNRDRFKQNLAQKTEQSYKTKDDNANTFKDYLDKDKTDGIKMFKMPKGDKTLVMDIIPYFAGDNDPKNAPGDPVYCLDINVHQNIGPGDHKIVCLAQYNKACPICEEIERRRAAEEDYDSRIKPQRPSRRTMYNIVIRDNKGEEEKKGVQVLEIAHFFVEKKFAGISRNPVTGGIIVFSDPDEGKSLCFTKRNPTKDTVEYSAHQFLDRQYPVSDAELDAAVTLDSIIKIMTYKEIEEILFASAPESGEEQERSTPAPTQEPPPMNTGRMRRQESTPEPQTNPTPAPEPQAQTQEGGEAVCPHGGTIGESIDELNECMTCELYDLCNAIAESK